MTPEQIEAFLARPIVAVLSTVDGAGRPRSTPIWFHWEDGAAYMFTGRTSLKWRNLQARPHASLCVDTREPPYAAVVMDGPVEAVEDPARLYEVVLASAVAYYGDERGRAFAEPYRDRPSSVLFRLTPRRLKGWDYSEGE
ncbi:MAG: TIGR03618 family F420-dependent PPOX class oxidoreductase [Dehalococcoidia bacterium]